MDQDAHMGTIPDCVPFVTVRGRRVSYATCGDPAGLPVFSCHGTPGGRLNRHPDPAVYTEAGAWFITYDRPGYGWSDRRPGRSVADCVVDVEAIADALGVQEFAITGSSGGGPHALAVASLLPDRVMRARCNVSVAPFDSVDFFESMDPTNVAEFQLALRGSEPLSEALLPELASMAARAQRDAGDLLGDTWTVDDQDREILADPASAQSMIIMMGELTRAGVWGWVDDDIAMVHPWGFDPRTISVPVEVSYATRDTLVPVAHGQWLASNIPGAREVVREEGHLSPPDQVVASLRTLVDGW